jgi:glyoxylase-like metal-dependent hydrolase (beta-lactamase superfamily II)
MLLPAGNASAWTGPTGNNTYFLPGPIPTLIDAGVGAQEHLDAIATALAGSPLDLVLITHNHVDHVAGIPALRARWPRVEIRQFGAGDRPLFPDEHVPAGDGECTVLHTPGHSPDHCCFMRGHEIFCGDLVRIGGTVVIPASRGGDLDVYLESLRRVRDLHPARLLPAHGPMIANPSLVIDEYLAHRAAREAQIVDALREGAATPAEIVGRVYKELSEDLKPAAAESVLAHLIKLKNEGRVDERDDVWTHRR